MSQRATPTSITEFRIGPMETFHELHITGGIRAAYAGPGRWAWHPVVVSGAVRALHPTSIVAVAGVAKDQGAELFGGDQLSGMDTPLITRVWTPLNGSRESGLQPADRWGCISKNASDAGAARCAELAENIAFCTRAAGIRLRDASDQYRDQLIAAIERKQKPEAQFSNIPMKDLQLAFHSVLSELASARDYLAAFFAHQLGAPPNVDALNRLADWLAASSRADLKLMPSLTSMLTSYNSGSKDPWLFELTQYRNLFLHRRPLGSSNTARWLIYTERNSNDIKFPSIKMPLGANDPSAPNCDALLRFVGLHRRMTDLLNAAIADVPYSDAPQHFVLDGGGANR